MTTEERFSHIKFIADLMLHGEIEKNTEAADGELRLIIRLCDQKDD